MEQKTTRTQKTKKASRLTIDLIRQRAAKIRDKQLKPHDIYDSEIPAFFCRVGSGTVAFKLKAGTNDIRAIHTCKIDELNKDLMTQIREQAGNKKMLLRPVGSLPRARTTLTVEEFALQVYSKVRTPQAIANVLNTNEMILRTKLNELTDVHISHWLTNEQNILRDKNSSFGTSLSGGLRSKFVKPTPDSRKRIALPGSRLPQTIRKLYRSLSGMLSYAKTQNYIKENPAFKVRIGSQHNTNSIARIFSNDEKFSLIDAINNLESTRDKLIMAFALLAGMRKSEILYLTINNIEQRDGVAWANIPITKANNFRKVELSSSIIALYEDYKNSEEFVPNSSNYLFWNPVRQKPLQNVRYLFKSLLKRAGIKGAMRFYDLRHNFAYEFYGIHKDLVALKELLGHANIKTTDRYIHALSSQKSIQVESLSASFPIKAKSPQPT